MYQAAGIGPGIGTDDETAYMVKNFIKAFQHPLVLDADALNIISKSHRTFIVPCSLYHYHTPSKGI